MPEAPLVELLHVDLEYRLRAAGRTVRVGDYLDRFKELGAEAAADLVARDFDLRRQGGETVSARDYLARFSPARNRAGHGKFARPLRAGDGEGPDRDPRPGPSPGPRDRPVGPPAAEIRGPRADRQGGMGEVWRVRRTDLNVDRAVKVIHPSIALDAEALERMLREAQAMAQISHRHAVAVHDVATEPVPYIEMEYIRGRPLNEVLRAKVPMPLDWTARILGQLCDVLQVAHDQAIIHRDLKPSNLMLLDDRPPGEEFLKVLDFGIAKFLHTSIELTQNNLTLGTLMYMSPEQVTDAASVDPRSDLYTVGVILYEFLTGCRPFTSRTPQIQYDIVYTPGPRGFERNPEAKVPRAVEEFVLRCLEKDPARRPASARALAEEFRRLALPQTVPGVTPRRAGLTRRLLLASVVPVLGVSGFAAYRTFGPALCTLNASPDPLRVKAGEAKEVTILVGPGSLAGQVDVTADEAPFKGVRVIQGDGLHSHEIRPYRVETDLDTDPGPRTLTFRGSGARSVGRRGVVLDVQPPQVAPPAPRRLVAGPRGGARLVWADRTGADRENLPRTCPDRASVMPDGTVRGRDPDPQRNAAPCPEPFYIMEDKVWVGLFRALCGRTPRGAARRTQDGRRADPRLPVRYVTCKEAQVFAEWLGGKGRGFLPTEAQWDQAAGLNRKQGRAEPADPAGVAVKRREPLPVGQAAAPEPQPLRLPRHVR